MSIAFVLRLVQMEDAFSVLLETDYLEGIRETSRTKDEQPFLHELHPYWHKHFTTSRHVLKNIGIHWGLDKTGNVRLDRMLNEVARNHGHDADRWPGLIAYKLALGGYSERVTHGLTGDWIIFAKHNGINYYLDLAKHEEGDQPIQLLAKLRNGSFAEFPFLFEPNS